jgi:hypothetical protein
MENTNIDAVIGKANRLFRLHMEQGSTIQNAAQIGHDYIKHSGLSDLSSICEGWIMAKISKED